MVPVRNTPDLVTQYYLSGLVGFLVVEMISNLSASPTGSALTKS